MKPSKPNSASMKISIPVRQRKESFESECSTVDSCGMSQNEEPLCVLSSNEECLLSPKTRLARGLVSDYGCLIDSYLRKIEKENQLRPDHLSNH